MQPLRLTSTAIFTVLISIPVPPAMAQTTPGGSPAVATAPASPDTAATDAAATSEALKPGVLYYMQAEKAVEVLPTPVDQDYSIGAGALTGLGGAKTFLVLPGVTSELKITEPRPRFRAAVDRTNAMRLRLAMFEVKGETRRTQTDSGKMLEFLKKAIPLSVTQVSEGIYDFTPKADLKPGEYGFGAMLSLTVADFTVVAAGKPGGK